MKLLNSVIISSFAALSLLISSNIYADDHHTNSASFKSTKLTENIFMLQGKGGNIALIKGKQGLLMIDADYKEMSSALKTELKSYGGIDKVNYLINTHWHGDHTQGNEVIGLHAQIIAHENVRPRLLTAQEIKLFNMVSQSTLPCPCCTFYYLYKQYVIAYQR